MDHRDPEHWSSFWFIPDQRIERRSELCLWLDDGDRGGTRRSSDRATDTHGSAVRPNEPDGHSGIDDCGSFVGTTEQPPRTEPSGLWHLPTLRWRFNELGKFYDGDREYRQHLDDLHGDRTNRWIELPICRGRSDQCGACRFSGLC